MKNNSFKSVKFFTLFLSLSAFLISCVQVKNFVEDTTAPKIQSEEEKMSYFMGYILAENTKKTESALQTEAFIRGVRDNLKQKATALDESEIQSFSDQIQQKAMLKKQKQMSEKNKQEGEAFLTINKQKPGVKVTASGLQYEVLTEGKGKTASLQSLVEVNYRGTLINGTEFDSSYKNNSSASFPLNAVIKGWTEGLQLMKEGSKYKFYIPPNLAYGQRGAGQSIPPNSTLIFEVELLKVMQPGEAKKSMPSIKKSSTTKQPLAKKQPIAPASQPVAPTQPATPTSQPVAPTTQQPTTPPSTKQPTAPAK